MTASSRELLVVAGEASGDLHGARLISELRRRVPGLTVFGLGGDEMREAGLEPVAHSSEISVVGLTEALKILSRAREIFADLLREVDRRRPALAVLIDFPDFNLRLAKQLKERGVEVLYYISPQVWAWRRGRVKTISRLVDRMLVLFPFEVDFYRGHDVDVVHVGHPLVDEVPVLPQAWDRNGAADGSFDGPFRVALLPGSRASEVEALLPTLLESVKRLSAMLPVEARIIRAPTIPPEMVDEAVELAGVPVEIVDEDRFAAVADSHLALCASGTATLEVGLLGTPMIMVYRLASWTYALARLMVRLPNVSLVNLVLGRRVVPELIQGEANPERIAAEAARLLTDAGERGRMREALAEVRGRLGEGGASRRAAGEVAAMLAELAEVSPN
ncbi:MAG TPA: lipid-A-disaccharide synthase [Thermoanaerobaculia bacterium]|nr:lipid-A-disaccharide synthase [Thermoanaerobaculia bacterium]